MAKKLAAFPSRVLGYIQYRLIKTTTKAVFLLLPGKLAALISNTVLVLQLKLFRYFLFLLYKA